MSTILNEALAEKQKVTDEQRKNLYKLYDELNCLFAEEEELLPQEVRERGENLARKLTEIENNLQRNWNFDINPKFHTYEFNFKNCICPRLDNSERFGFEKIYNCGCPIHSFKCFKNKEVQDENKPLGIRMKDYEADYETRIPEDEHIIIRIDGHKFSKFTKGMLKPFDHILLESMNKTTIDLVEHFQAYTGFTQSDEITLYIPSLKLLEEQPKYGWKHMHSGRVQKIASLVSAYTTRQFNKHFREAVKNLEITILDTEVSEEERNNMWDYFLKMNNKVGNAWFDARVYGVPTNEEVLNSFLWRSRDCVKNSKSMFAQTYCSHRELMNKTAEEQIQYCKDKTGNDWNEILDRYKYGYLVKRKEYRKVVELPEKIKPHMDVKTVLRTQILGWSEELSFDEVTLKKIIGKYLKD